MSPCTLIIAVHGNNASRLFKASVSLGKINFKLVVLYIGTADPRFSYCCSVRSCVGSNQIQAAAKTLKDDARIAAKSNYDAP